MISNEEGRYHHVIEHISKNLMIEIQRPVYIYIFFWPYRAVEFSSNVLFGIE